MTSSQSDAPDVGNSIDITADPADLDTAPEDKPATSVAEEYQEDGDTLGGTGGRDAGGAG